MPKMSLAARRGQLTKALNAWAVKHWTGRHQPAWRRWLYAWMWAQGAVLLSLPLVWLITLPLDPDGSLRHISFLNCVNLPLGFLMLSGLAEGMMSRLRPRRRPEGVLIQRRNGGQAVHVTAPSLRGAELAEEDLSWAVFHREDLSAASLRGARLTHAWLRFADLSGADLRDALLSGANLTLSDLRRADLRGADLRGRRREGGVGPALLDGAELEGAIYDDSTRWPEFFDPVQAGARCVLPTTVEPSATWATRSDANATLPLAVGHKEP